MRIAIYQCEPRPAQVDRNLERLACIAKHASTRGVDLLVCPEMYLTGYNIGIDAVRELAESSDGQSAHAVAEMTRENSVAIIYGYPERGTEDVIFNSAQLFNAKGTPLANYSKTHLFGDLDNSMFCASDADSAVVELGGWRVGMLICYDVEFPENTRKLALRGTDLTAALVASAPTSIMRAQGEPVIEGKRHAVLAPSRDEIRCDQLKNDGLKRHAFVRGKAAWAARSLPPRQRHRWPALQSSPPARGLGHI
jgi:predicted amidohydrolase